MAKYIYSPTKTATHDELWSQKKKRVGKKGQGELNAPPRASKAGMSNTEAGGWLPRAVFFAPSRPKLHGEGRVMAQAHY